MKRQGNILIVVLLVILAACGYFILSNSSGEGDENANYKGKINHRIHGRDRSIVFSLNLTDESGKPIKVVKKTNGKRMKPPTVQLLDKDGKQIHSFQLRYG